MLLAQVIYGRLLSELDGTDVATFEVRPPQLPLRLTSRNRIEFQHDLAAEWGRFQRLKEIAHATGRWAALATNPLWTDALRMLGQFLLRERVGGRSAWDVAFETIGAAQEATPLAADVLLDALCIDPLAESLLTERAELLFGQDGGRLDRLLRRFDHIATAPGGQPEIWNTDPSLRLYMEAQYRVPIIARWPAVARFLAAHRERVAGLMSPVVAGLCERWLTTTPVELAPGAPTPYRKEFAEIALATARALQVAQGSEKPIYTAAFAGAPDLPEEVSAWALEMAQRRPYREDVAAKIAEHYRQRAQEHVERLRTDPVYRARQQQRASFPTYIPSARKLPPWPLGPQSRVERAFRECCIHSAALISLMRVRPEIAAEVLLAAIIEDSPEEKYNISYAIDQDFGLASDHKSYPTAYWKSPFFAFLQINSDIALGTLITLVEFCTDRWAHECRRHGAEPRADIVVALHDATTKLFTGNHIVFDWVQTNSLHAGQLHSALAALERWLCMMIDNGTNVAPYIDRILRTSNSVSLLGVILNVGKYHPDLFRGPLRPLLADHELYRWDDYRCKALSSHFDASAWARHGEVIYQMAREWCLAPYRQVTLSQLAMRLVAWHPDIAEFLAGVIQQWQQPSGEKDALEFRILTAGLDHQNYRTVCDDATGQIIVQVEYPEDLRRDVLEYQQAQALTIQTRTLPWQCQQLLSNPDALTAQQATALATALAQGALDAETRLDEDEKRRVRVAVASTLLAKAPEWLNENSDVRCQAWAIIQTILAAIEETPDLFRDRLPLRRGSTLEFVAHAVITEWIATNGTSDEACSAVLRILTSGDDVATQTLMTLVHESRSLLGSKWWRLLYLALLWSGLSILAPRFDEPPSMQLRWNRWLRWLRSRSFTQPNVTSDCIDPLAIARRVERLERRRWTREYARKGSRLSISPEDRRSSGLDTYLLECLFGWLLRDGPEEQSISLEGGERQKLLQALIAFELWHRHTNLDEKDRDATPSHLGYKLLSTVAQMVPGIPLDSAADLWEPVFRLGAAGHYSIGHFISCWLGQVSRTVDPSIFSQHWRAMIEYALSSPQWNADRLWFYREQLLCRLLGCGSERTLDQVDAFQTIVLQMRDLYESWAQHHLNRDEDNVARLCGFLSSSTGRHLRIDGLQWLLHAMQGQTRASHWHRTPTGGALTDFLDVTLSDEVDKLSADTKARDAVLALIALLVTRQVPAALALQERARQVLAGDHSVVSSFATRASNLT